MRTVNVHAAKTNFSKLLDEVAAGEEIVIAKAGRPVARLVAFEAKDDKPRRRLGSLAGIAVIPEEFYLPLPDDILADFEGA